MDNNEKLLQEMQEQNRIFRTLVQLLQTQLKNQQEILITMQEQYLVTEKTHQLLQETHQVLYNSKEVLKYIYKYHIDIVKWPHNVNKL